MSSPGTLRRDIESSPLYNPDLAPVSAERRTWSTYNYAALWVSMSVNILTYMLAASFIQTGMNWKQALVVIFVGNTIVLAPMLLNSHPGARYGIPFPVLARASFGVLGANVAAVARGLVACGWFGIQSWIGGQAINTLLKTVWPAWGNVSYGTPICFMAFWLINLLVILKGIEYIRFLQGWSAPVLLGVGLLLLGWAYFRAGGFGTMLSAPSKFSSNKDFLKALVPALNGAVGFWSTVSLNIPDFTRFAKNQRGQMIGQAIALPLTMTLYAFIGVAVTSATVVIYGSPVWNPVDLLSRFQSPVVVIISLLAILLATLNVNIGANVVSPANDFSNLWPRKISFKMGGVITCFLGIAMMPWKLLANYDTFVVQWLGTYAAVLGSVAGIMICDYFVIRHERLVTDDLYLRDGEYEYTGGFNWRAITALCIGSAVALMGSPLAARVAEWKYVRIILPFLRDVVHRVAFLYDYSWFVGFIVAFAVYWTLMAGKAQRFSLQTNG